MTSYTCLETELTGGVLSVWLNRPELRNAFNAELIGELADCFGAIGAGGDTRVVVLGGRGPVFCSGADLHWMQEMVRYSEAENQADALRLAQMLAALDGCACPVLGRVQKAAFGGALGLLACCDSVIATSDAQFGFPEVRLGIAPATIAPYVVSKIGVSNARDLFLSGETFGAEHARRIGLVHQVVEPADLDAAVSAKLTELLKAGPLAAAETKKLIRQVSGADLAAYQESTARLIAALRVSEEGQDGLKAALDKRKPSWR
jgi:methylglutaconyl-CoA hydratase